MSTKLPYVLPFDDGSEVAEILLKAQKLPDKEEIATKTELQKATAYQENIDNSTMAPQSAAVKRETDKLQAQINNIVRAPESGGDVSAEVYQARVNADGQSYETLKERLDAEQTQLKEDFDQCITDGQLYVVLENEIGKAREEWQSAIGIITPQMYGASGDGVHDDTEAFQTALNQGGTIFVPSGNYLITSALEIKHKNTNLFGTGTLIGGITEGADAVIIIDNDLYQGEMVGIIIDGLSFTAQTEMSISAVLVKSNVKSGAAAENIVLRNLKIDQMTGNGIHLHGGTRLYDGFIYPRVLVESCNIISVAKVGICQSCVASIIKNCYVFNSGYENITVDNGCVQCIISQNRLIFNNGGAGNISVDESDLITIENNIIESHTVNSTYDYPINFNGETGRSANVKITNNTLLGGIYTLRSTTNSYNNDTSFTFNDNICILAANGVFSIGTISWASINNNISYVPYIVSSGTSGVMSFSGNVKI